MKAYKLKFYSGFHVNTGDAVDGPSETFIRSDTLFSALCSAAAKLYGSEIVEAFLTPSAVRLSSAFPFHNDELFFPKPANFSIRTDNSTLRKVFKKVKFVAKEHLSDILNGLQISGQLVTEEYIMNGCWRARRSSGKHDAIFRTQENPHVVIDRIGNSTQLFFKTEVFFSSDAGLFFAAEIEPALQQKFEAVLHFLGDEGIGADRTTGKGLFSVERIPDFSFGETAERNGCLRYYLLSLYTPSENEFNNIEPKNSFYEFVPRSGWVTGNTLRRQAVRMFSEGSVLAFKEPIDPKGALLKVMAKENFPGQLETDIFRSGQVLAIPMKGEMNAG